MRNRHILSQRVGELALGYSVNQLSVWVFDYALYPLVIAWLGLLWGFVVMAGFSFIICLLTIWFYDWSKRDWLGIEAVKSLKGYDGSSRSARLLSWMLRKGDPVACVLLSIRYDPFITTVYMRRGRFGGMARRDWYIFVLSWLISNVYWSLVCFGGVTFIRMVWTRLDVQI